MSLIYILEVEDEISSTYIKKINSMNVTQNFFKEKT